MVLDVLVVDDSDVIRTMILKTLRLANVPLGASYEASNGKEALEVLEDNWVDLVLADINMPVMDGMELIERIRASRDFADVPVVVVTTDGAEMSYERLQALRVDAFLRKPFTPEQIRDVLDEVTNRLAPAEHREALENVLAEVLMLFAMMYGEATTGDIEPPPPGGLMRAHMSFCGAASGALTIAAPLQLCTEMAANALGVELAEAHRCAADAVGELVNMTCGLIATHVEKHDTTKLSTPEVTAMDADDWEALERASGTVRFLVEERPMLASLMLRSV